MCHKKTETCDSRKDLRLADIIRAHADRLPPMTAHQVKVLSAIMNCRTASVGGHKRRCEHCGHLEISYNSCRDRHCPRCQSLNALRWMESRRQDLLPVEYFHLVFTIPDARHRLFLLNPSMSYALLFQAVSETLQEVAWRPKNLGAQIGFTAVLHTWTQTLLYHPHLYCIVSGGGLSSDGTQWVSCKRGYFLPVHILSQVFRGKLLNYLEKSLDKGCLHGDTRILKDMLRKASRKSWVVFSKPPVAGPKQVLKYLAQYTHRVAISNHRLLDMNKSHVTFSYKDRSNGDKKQTMRLEVSEFIRRFLLHILPKGFVRIRHYGFLANGKKRTTILFICTLLNDRMEVEATKNNDTYPSETWQEMYRRLTGRDVNRCPKCGKGVLIYIERIPAAIRKWRIGGRETDP